MWLLYCYRALGLSCHSRGSGNPVVKSYFHGGETGSTGVRKLELHTEVPPGLVKKVGLNTNADDYAYAVAA
jgi:hypothetical protein